MISLILKITKTIVALINHYLAIMALIGLELQLNWGLYGDKKLIIVHQENPT